MNDLGWFRDHHAENMERMFAAVSDLYARYWGDFFHFAIFDRPDQEWSDAFDGTHRRYASALRAGRGSKVIELACGRGGFADFLAAETGADVLGIDISRAQLRRAKRHRRPNLHFLHHDIMRVDELDSAFDAVVLMDADIYLPDKRSAVERVAHVMKPGARFLLIAWCKQEGLSALQQETVLDPFLRYWGAPGLETADAYRSHFRKAGLHLIEEEDLNDKVRPNWEEGYRRAIDAIKELDLASAGRLMWTGLRVGPDGLRLIREQFPAALYIKAAFDAGFLRYTLFLTEKNGSAT